jgi:hypothetical protein
MRAPVPVVGRFKAVKFDFDRLRWKIWPGRAGAGPLGLGGDSAVNFIARRVDLFCAFPDDKLLAVRDINSNSRARPA